MDGSPTDPTSMNGHLASIEGERVALDDESASGHGLWRLEQRHLPMLTHCLDCQHARLDHPGGGACDPTGLQCDCRRFAAPPLPEVEDGAEAQAQAQPAAEARPGPLRERRELRRRTG